MRTLKAAVIVMGVLIVAGVITIAVTIAQRLGGGGTPAHAVAAVLDEPAGTRIAQIAALPDRLVLSLQGGGADRVVVLDLRSGTVVARAGLTR